MNEERCPVCGGDLTEEIEPGYSEGEYPFIWTYPPIIKKVCEKCKWESEEEEIYLNERGIK